MKKHRLFEMFASEFIVVMINETIEDITQTEESVQSSKHPIQLAGFLSDMDDEYLYLGAEPNTVSQAIKRDVVIHIQLADPDDMEDISAIPEPTNKGLN